MQPSRSTERIEWTRSPDLPGVDILVAADCAHRWRVYHETYTVCTGLAIGAPAQWKYRGGEHLQTADGLMLMEPGEIHANHRITEPASFRVLMIPPSEVARAAAESGAGEAHVHFNVAQVHGGPLHRAFAALHESVEGEASALERQTRFAACLRLLFEHCAEKRPRPVRAIGAPAVERARAFIHAHIAEAISLDDLAAAAGGVSRFHLAHAFARRVGLPPHQYQLQLRISRAGRLLAAGVQPADVAAELGFADQSHFSRHFRKVRRVTPAVFARRNARTF